MGGICQPHGKSKRKVEKNLVNILKNVSKVLNII